MAVSKFFCLDDSSLYHYNIIQKVQKIDQWALTGKKMKNFCHIWDPISESMVKIAQGNNTCLYLKFEIFEILKISNGHKGQIKIKILTIIFLDFLVRSYNLPFRKICK